MRKSRLSSARPGTSAGPFAPPSSAPARVRRSRPESCAAAPWQFQQVRSMMGRMWSSNVTGGVWAAALAASAAEAASVRTAATDSLAPGMDPSSLRFAWNALPTR